jgi:hypothetical protein
MRLASGCCSSVPPKRQQRCDADAEMAKLPTLPMRRLLSTFIGTLRAEQR